MSWILKLLGIDDERAENLNRVWNGKRPTAPLEGWNNYRRDKDGNESGQRAELVGRKYQQLQGLRIKEDE